MKTLKNIPTAISGFKAVNLVYIAVFLIVVLIFIWKFRDWFTTSIDEQTGAAAKKEINKNELTYDKSQYNAWADKLDQAFSDFWGTTNESVYEVFENMRTKSDVLQLIIAFGERWYWGNLIPWQLNLPATIEQDMRGSQMDKINDILSNNGIDFKF